MSLRGSITVECDEKDCHAEEVLEASDVRDFDAKAPLSDAGWRYDDALFRWTCPQCLEEGKRP